MKPIPDTAKVAKTLCLGKAWDLGEDLLLEPCKRDRTVKWLLMTHYCYTHSTEHCSALIWEDLPSVDGDYQRPTPTLDNVQSMRDFGALSSKWNVLIEPFPSRLRNLWGRGDKTIMKARGGWHQGNNFFQTQQIWQTYELTDWSSKHEPCPASNQTKAQHSQDMDTKSQEAICNWYLLGKGKEVFCNGECGTANHTPGRMAKERHVLPLKNKQSIRGCSHGGVTRFLRRSQNNHGS